MITPYSNRKRPKCRKCHLPMAGHPRKDGKLVCEDEDVETKDVESDSEQPPTPPQSPSPLPKQTPSPFHCKESAPVQRIKSEPYEVLLNGVMRWRNPNATFPSPYRPPPREGSLQSTVPCDSEGNSIHIGGSERIMDHGDNDEPTPIMRLPEILERIYEYAEPAVFTFSVHEQNLRMVQGLAEISGLHSAVIANPRSRSRRTSSASSANGEEEGHFWLAVSREQENLRHVINPKMPGTMPSILEAEEWAKATKPNTMPPAWRWLIWFIQLVFASMIGGLVVVWGLALIVN